MFLRRESTRQPSWRIGKRATAVRVWRPVAKKSTADQRYAISYWWLIVTVAALLTVCEIFSHIEVENRHFNSPTVFWLLVELASSCKRGISGLQFCRWQYRSIFIRLAVVASQICEITRNSDKIRTYSSSRSSKVIDLDANLKRICNFLLVINSNFGRISYRFRDIDA